MNWRTLTLLSLAFAALMLSGSAVGEEDDIDELDDDFVPWIYLRGVIVIVVVFLLIAGIKLEDRAKYMAVSLALLLLLVASLTMLSWYTTRTWVEDTDDGGGDDGDYSGGAVLQFGLTYIYVGMTLGEDTLRNWIWHDSEFYEDAFDDEKDVFIVPIVLLILALGLLIAAIFISFIKPSISRFLSLGFGGMCFIAGLYFIIRLHATLSEGDALFSYESEDDGTLIQCLGLGWFSVTIFLPLLSIWMFRIAGDLGDEVTTITARSDLSAGGSNIDPRRKAPWEDAEGALFGRGGKFDRDYQTEQEADSYPPPVTPPGLAQPPPGGAYPPPGGYPQGPPAEPPPAGAPYPPPSGPPPGGSPPAGPPPAGAPYPPSSGPPPAGSPPAGAPPAGAPSLPMAGNNHEPSAEVPPAPPGEGGAAPGDSRTITCPACGHSFAVPGSSGPQQVTCPSCGISGTITL